MLSNHYTLRYPGQRPFSTDESALFFGRQAEIKALYQCVQAHPLVVLFGQTGVGKTSLLRAGLLPLLAQEGYDPIEVSFQNTAIAPLQALWNAVKHRAQQQGLEAKIAERLGARTPSLWEYLKAYSLEQFKTPIFVFDQWADFFLHRADAQKEAIDHLVDLWLGRVPQSVLGAAPQGDWASPLNWKTLLSVQTASLGLLDDLSSTVPTILAHRYQLHPLQRKQAKEAITAPAALALPSLQSPVFQYEERALDVLIGRICNEKGEVDATELQDVCALIEQQILQRKPAAPILVDESYLNHKNVAEKPIAPKIDPMSRLRGVPVSNRMSNMFLLAITLMFLHKIECWLTDEWVASPFFNWMVAFGFSLDPNKNAATGEIIFYVFIFWLYAGLIMGWMLMRGGLPAKIALSVWGLTFILEWHHPFRMLSLGGYYPGGVTAVIYLPVMFWYWVEWVRFMRSTHKVQVHVA